MAAIALMGSVIMGCSENDLVENTPQGKAVTLSTTISLDGSSATTRALDADGKKTFAPNEQIALIYESAENGAQKVIATLQATDISSDKKKATLTFALDKAPKADGNFTMIYPASMAQEPLPSEGEFGTKASPAYTKLASQDGTLASLSSNLDLAYCESQFSSNATLPYTIQLSNKLAILELTSITDYTGTNDLTSTITGLTVKVGSDASASTYTVTRTAAAGPIYVAMQHCSESDITVSATDGTYWFEKTVTSQSLAANSMTPINIKMWKKVELSQFTTDGQEYTAQNGEMLKGTLGANVMISIEADAAVALKDVNINGDGAYITGNYAGITCIGNATIFLEGTNKVHGFADGYPGILAASNGSESDYTLTIKGDGSLEATGSNSGAGIGSGYQGTCGNIKIEGGNITATGGTRAAGIGSGYDGTCGTITISGGTITSARSGVYGAGIGSGNYGTCGTITISGGEIKEATGGSNAAGIGSGYNGACVAITISGGTIEATGGDYAAGIGCGVKSNCGDITIKKGVTKVIATKGNNHDDLQGAPKSIGKASEADYICTCGTVTIEAGANVTQN